MGLGGMISILFLDGLGRLREYRDEIKERDERKPQEKELQFEHVLHETRMEFQAESKRRIINRIPYLRIVAMRRKLNYPFIKIEITKFEGSYEDWPRFWGSASVTHFDFIGNTYTYMHTYINFI